MKEKRLRRGGGILLMLLCLLGFPAGRGEGNGVSLTVPPEPLRPWESALIRFTLPEDAKADLFLTDGEGREIMTVARDVLGIAGQNSLFWNGTHENQAAPAGDWILRLEAEDAFAEAWVRVEAAEDGEAEGTEEPAPGETEETPAPAETDTPESAETEKSVFTPSHTSPMEGQDTSLNYWTLPMDIRDEAAIWQVLTAPITVVDSGDGEKAQVTIRETPAWDSAGVGVVTCVTQGVHVLERGGKWSLIECYSSSFHNSKILNWNTLVQGYVPTEFLREEIPSQEMGMVIDKLTQRLYIFREGRLFSTLLVSTGLANRRQPYNETRSGEFLLTSKVGTFSSDNLKCGMAIRFNSGDLLHEVPYILGKDGKSKNYSSTEGKLGTRASHGCIRVQRKQTPEGVNMAWIWENLKKNSKTRLLIWEDWQGRQIEVPGDLELYYTPEKGKYYHAKATCASVSEGVVMEPFAYSQLEEKPYRKLKRCEYCAPMPRPAEIQKINRTYAPGGDHEPVLTEARKKCPRPYR